MVATQEARTFNLLSLENIRNLEEPFAHEVLDVLANPENAELLDTTEGWVWDADPIFYNGPSEISVASAFYGRALNSPEEIFQSNWELMKKLGYPEMDKIPNLTGTSGFPKLRQMSPGLRDEDYLLVQQLVAQELITNALEVQKLTPNDVDLLLVATSIPISPDFYDQWRRASGIPDGVPVVPYCMACNSSGQALADLHEGKFDELISQYNIHFEHGEVADVVLFALDDPNREEDKGGDPLSAQVFSTGASAMVFRYHPTAESSMRMITHTSRSEQKGTEYLKVRKTYEGWTAEEVKNLKTAPYLQSPKHLGPVDMSPKAGIIFGKYAFEVTQTTLEKYKAMGYDVSRIKKVIMHHPSLAIFKKLRGNLKGLGIDESKMNWVINEGNVPVATILMALGRQLEDLLPGDHVMILSYGAGGEYTCQIVEMGKVTE